MERVSLLSQTDWSKDDGEVSSRIETNGRRHKPKSKIFMEYELESGEPDDAYRLLQDTDGAESCAVRRLAAGRRSESSEGSEERDAANERRFPGNTLARFFLFSIGMISFFVLMYIPVYNKANTHLVPGWSMHTSRDTKAYIQPGNISLIHDPKQVCPKKRAFDKKIPVEKDGLFLLIVVCSSTVNFKARSVIRETWASYDNYDRMSATFEVARQKFKNLNLTNSDSNNKVGVGSVVSVKRSKRFAATKKAKVRFKRSLSNVGLILPQIEAVLKRESLKKAKSQNAKTDESIVAATDEEARFEESQEDKLNLLPEFEMDKVLGSSEKTYDELDYADGESNVMKIPPRGFEESEMDLDKIVSAIRMKTESLDELVDANKTDLVKSPTDAIAGSVDNNLVSLKVKKYEENSTPASDRLRWNREGSPPFKVLFLLGLPAYDNDTDVQALIDEEASQYGDIIQEDFIDSYNNLTLKSVMLLKWVVTHCDKSVRYILKTDDDMFVNVPNLVRALRNKSAEFDNGKKIAIRGSEEHLLIGDLICGARPVSDSNNKWFSPRYMYDGRVYPRYLSGTGYALSAATARALYYAALDTPLFHLEDIYITGMCAVHARPRIRPQDYPGFSYLSARPSSPPELSLCQRYVSITSHRVQQDDMKRLVVELADVGAVERCERLRLAQQKRTLPKIINKLKMKFFSR